MSTLSDAKPGMTSFQKGKKKQWVKLLACLTVFVFIFNQIHWAYGYETLSPASAEQNQKTISLEETAPVTPPATDNIHVQNSTDFLSNTLTLEPVTDKESASPSVILNSKDENNRGQLATVAPPSTRDPEKLDSRLRGNDEPESNAPSYNYDYERYEFQDALDLLRPEYASAVIVKNLTEENLHQLTELGFETAVAVIHGEIVILTSGSEDEIGTVPAARDLFGKAAFISHTHPTEHSAEGPSGQDLNEAVEAPEEEYVVTHSGVYAYNREGILYGGKPQSYEWYLEKLQMAADKEDSDQVAARQDLNTFIAAQDSYNQAAEDEKVTLRRGGTMTFTSGLTASSVTTLAGSPFPYITAGSTTATTLAYTSSVFQLGYSVPNSADTSGFVISFDNATTPAVETQNISALANLTFGLKGPNTAVTLEIVDINGNKDVWALTNISNTTEQFWKLPVSSIANTIDKTKISKFNFIVAQSNTTSATRTGTLSIRANGLTTAAPSQPVVTSAVPVTTNQTTVTLSGTKEANTAILINGTQVVARDALTTWTATVNLTADGNNTFSITTKNSIGLISTVKSVTIQRDTVVPTGSININSSALYTASQNVTLNLSATDALSGIDKMSFSTDNVNWSAAETYAASKTFSLPAGDGNKAVYVKYYDKAGNVSAVYSKTILLDMTAPAGSLGINSGALYAASTAVTLNLSGTDSGSGMDKMSFSTDNVSWSAPEVYAAAKSFTLPSGEGNKTVYVRYYDKAGNVSLVYSKSIILDTIAPSGTVTVNGGITATNQTAVTLNLSASDAGSGLDKMSFSSDNVTWSTAEVYAATKAWTFSAGDGNKTVYVKFLDKSGKWSSVVSATVLLDTVKPATGSININSGAVYATATAVTLNLSATDAASGMGNMSFSTDNVNWSAPEVYATTKSFTLPSGDGSKTVYVRYYDKAGNVSVVYSKSIILDTLAPAGTVSVNNGAVAVNQTAVTLNFAASDAGSGLDKMSFSSDNLTWSAAETYAVTKAWTFSAGDGNKTVYVKFTDKSGKTSSPVSVTVLLDTVKPTGSININSGAAYSNSQTVTLNLSAADAASGIAAMSFSTDNVNWTTPPETYAASRQIGLPAGDGNKTVYVKYYDKAGNVSPVYSKTILLDTTPPSGTLILSSGALYTNSVNISAALSVTDAGAGLDQMRYSVDNGQTWSAWENYAASKALTLPSGDGNKLVQFQIRDKAANVQVLSANIGLDTTPITGSIKINADAAATNQTQVTLNLTASDTFSGLGQMRFTTDTVNWIWTAWEDFKTTKTFTLPSGDGLKQVFWQIYDKAWNLTSGSDTILLDATVPTASFTINNGAALTNNMSVNLQISASDSGSGLDAMSFAINSTDPSAYSAWETFNTSKTLMLPNYQGPNYVNIKIRDKAGNITYLWKSIVLDTVAPTGSLSINNDAAQTVSRDVSLTLSGTDSNSGIDQMRFSQDGGATWTVWENYAASKTLSLAGDSGTKTVLYQVKDKAGNLSTSYSKSILLQLSVVPVIQFTSASQSGAQDYLLTYTVNGSTVQENWKLAPGDNDLLVRASVNGVLGYAKFRVTWNQPLPSFPQMPAIPDAPADLISVTTDSGHVLHYSQGVLWSVEQPGEYELFSPELDANGNLTGGVLKYLSGDQVILKDSKPLFLLSALGDKTLYDSNSNAALFQSASGQSSRFSYRTDTSGNIVSLLSLEAGVSSLYEKGEPAWIVMTDGTDIRYDSGFLKEYRDPAGNLFSYTTQNTQDSAGVVTGYVSQLMSVTPAGTSTPVLMGNLLNSLGNYPSIKQTLETKLSLTMEYNAQKQMKEFTSGKNEILELQNNLPVSLKDSTGKITGIHVGTTAAGDLDSLSFSQLNLGQAYDEAGKLTTVTLSDGTQLGVQDQQLTQIILSDSSVLTGLKWNGSVLTDFVRARADGGKETYQAQNLIRKEDPNGTVTTYIHVNGTDHPDLMTMPDGRTYHFIEYQNAQGLTERISELVSMDLGDGSRIEFEQGKPVRYIQKKQVQLDPQEIPVLPAGESYIPSVTLTNAELRGVTIDANATILSGEILFHDGTQYLIQNGELYKQITPDGTVIELSNQDPPPPQTFPDIPPQWYSNQELAYKDQLINSQLDYFISGAGIDPVTGFPVDNYDASTHTRSTYSQATLVGMWAEILAAIARGHYVTPKMTSAQAYQKLQSLLLNLIDVQQQAGWNGMISFFGISQQTQPILDASGKPTGQTQTVNVYKRQFGDVGIGDNLNLSVSLSSVIGAIAGTNDPATNTMRDNIVAYAYHILWKQDPGYTQFYDSATKRFHMAYQFNPDGTGQFAGWMDRVFNEFRTGLIWLASQKPEYQDAVKNLDVAIRPYETADGQAIDNAVPFDGGAFQMFWPLMHVDETKYPEFDVALKNFLYTQAEYVKANGIPGLLSAGADPGQGYNGKMGLPEASETDDTLKTQVGSIYGTASAFLLAPHYTLQFLQNLQAAFPGILSSYGYADAMTFQNVPQKDPVTGQMVTTKQPVFSNQYYGVDQASFLLSMMGTSRSYFGNYLDWQGIHGTFDNLYSSMIFGLAPVAGSNPAAPDFNPNGTSKLFSGQDPDGSLHTLVKKPAFVSTITDPDYGQGNIFNYLTPNGQYHHTEIEFSGKIFDLQQYILLPGRGDAALSLTEGLKFDLLKEGTSQGAFYTVGQGYANSVSTVDPEIGEANRLEFDFQSVTKPVGLWANYSNLDLSRYDYISVPAKLAPGTSAGVRLKIELKGMGEVYISPDLTSDWQFVQIPVTKPAGPLTQIAVSIQSIDGSPVKGEVLMGPLSAVKVRVSNNIDWLITLGKTDTDLKNLLKQAAAQQPALGGGMVEGEEVLENFTLDHDGKLVNGILHLADGGIQYYQKGQLMKWIFPNGHTVLFEKGLATFAIDLARGKLEEGRFYYDETFHGEIRSFVLQDNDSKRIYGADGKLQTMIDAGRIVQFKDGVIDSITLPDAVMTQILFSDDGNLLKAHVLMNDGLGFDIDQTASQQMIVRPNGVKIYYQGDRIVGIETPQNGKTTFDYVFNAVAQLLGVNATFNETIPDPVTGAPSLVSRTMSIAAYLQRPERSVEKSELLQGTPYSVLPYASIGGFSIGTVNPPELTYALPSQSISSSNGYYLVQEMARGLKPGDAAAYLFQYQNISGSLLGAYFNHPSTPVTISNYGFLSITLRQDPSMNWNQDFNLKLKTPQNATLFNFELQNATQAPQTFGFSLDGKLGTEGAITLEVAREAGGVGKLGKIYLQDISYFSLKTLDKPLWEDQISINRSQLRDLKTEADRLTSVGAEVASRQPLHFDNLAAELDLPSWVVYSDQSASVTGQLVSFKRFDGSEVFVDGNQSVTKVILPDGTVNEYSQTGSGPQNVIQGPSTSGADSQTADYHYGEIRSVTQADGRKYNFSYEFDSAGGEITVMTDTVTGEQRRFQNGQLIQSSTGALQTKYSYADGDLAAANLMYKNRVLQSTSYHYTPDETLITDDQGTVWYYDPNGNLIKHLTKDGYLYNYSDYTFEPQQTLSMATDDYKRAIFAATDLRSVTFSGYEAADGSQLILDSSQGDPVGEIKFINGDHGVNLGLDGDRKIKNGQIQFKDGLIVEIENYIPVRGRLATGEAFSLAPPAGDSYELLQDSIGAYLGERVKVSDKFYTYDVNGRLIKVEDTTGGSDTFTYTLNGAGVPTAYQDTHAAQLAFHGVPFPKQVDMQGGSSQKILDSGTEVLSHDGNGFVISVFKEDVNQWDSISGTFSSGADRFTLQHFLQEIKPGQSVAMIVSDPSFMSAGDTILTLLEGLGAGQVRTASAANQSWAFFGSSGLNKGEASEKVGGTGFSTITKTVSNISIPAGAAPMFGNQPLVTGLPVSVSTAYSRFLQNYETLKPSVDTFMVTVYDKNENVVFSKRIDGAYSYYQNGKIRETFDAAGELLSVNEYTCPPAGCLSADDMTLSRITLVKARADFQKQSADLQQQIEQVKFDALYRLAWQDEAARLRVQEEVTSGIASIDSQISYLQSIRFQDVKQCHKGLFGIGKSCQHFTVEVPGVEGMINDLYSQRAQILSTKETELTKIPGQVAAMQTEIQTASSGRLADLEAKRQEILNDILTEEMKPVLTDFYRRILGRDPSTAEITDWVTRSAAAQKLDITALTSTLTQSPERTQRINQKAAIITNVKSFLEQYVAAATAQKNQMLASLNLQTSEVMDLDRTDLDGIYHYLDTRDLHFGQSAFGSLQAMLKAKGVDIVYETLGKEALLIDILTGVINRFTDSELLLSVFALERTAKIHGQDFEGVKYSYDDLKAAYDAACPNPASACSMRMIAHVTGDHFVLVTRVTADGVTFIEVNQGASGEEKTLTRDQFLKVWNIDNGQGYLLADKPQVTEAKRVSDAQAQKIRGSFFIIDDIIFWSLVISVTLSVASIAVSYISPTLGKILGYAAMVAGIVGIVASVGTVVVNGLKAAYTAISTQGFFGAVKTGLQTVGNFIVQSVHDIGHFLKTGFSFIKDGFSGGLSNLGSGITKIKDFLLTPGRIIFDADHNVVESLFTQQQVFARSIVAAGLNYSVSKGLEGLGLDSTLVALGGAFISAGVLGAGSGLSGFLKSGVQGFLMQGVSEMGLKLNLPPPVTNALSLVTGASLNSWFNINDLTLKQNLAQIAPLAAKQFTLGGAELLGRSLGWNPRISQLAGYPIAGLVGGIVSGLTNVNGGPGGIFRLIKSEVLSTSFSGALSVGADFTLEKLNLDSSLLASLSARLAFGVIKDFINQKGRMSLTESLTKIGGKIGESFIDPYIIPQLYAAINTKGLAQGFEEYAVKVLRRDTVEDFVATGLSLGALIDSTPVHDGEFHGNPVKIIQLGRNDKLIRFIYKSVGGKLQIIAIEEKTSDMDKLINFNTDLNGAITDIDIEVEHSNGEATHRKLQMDGRDSIQFTDWNGEIFGEVATNSEGELEFINYNLGVSGTINQSGKLTFDIKSPELSHDFSGFIDKFNTENLTDEQKSEIYVFFVGNGFWNTRNNKDFSPDLSIDFINNLTQDEIAKGQAPIVLLRADGSIAKDKAGNILTTASLPLTLYEETSLIGNALKWSCETWFGCTSLTDELSSELNDYFDLIQLNVARYGLDPNKITSTHFAHSGNFEPMIKALSANPNLPIKTVINYEGPYIGDAIVRNSHLETMIQVHGTRSFLEGDVAVPFLDFNQFKGIDANGNVKPITNYYIEILGAGHSDFDCPSSGCVEDSVNAKTNLFMRDLALVADNKEQLTFFLSSKTPGVTINNGIVEVDPSLYVSPNGER